MRSVRQKDKRRLMLAESTLASRKCSQKVSLPFIADTDGQLSNRSNGFSGLERFATHGRGASDEESVELLSDPLSIAERYVGGGRRKQKERSSLERIKQKSSAGFGYGYRNGSVQGAETLDMRNCTVRMKSDLSAMATMSTKPERLFMPAFNTRLPNQTQQLTSSKHNTPANRANPIPVPVPRQLSEKPAAFMVEMHRYPAQAQEAAAQGFFAAGVNATQQQHRAERIQIDGYRRCFAHALGLKNASYVIARTTSNFDVEPNLSSRNEKAQIEAAKLRLGYKKASPERRKSTNEFLPQISAPSDYVGLIGG